MAHHGSFKAYKITNTLDGRAYIGITRQELARRWRFHVSWATRGLRGVLADAIRDHGEAAFTIEHLASARTWDDLCAVEQILIGQERTLVMWDGGYNVTQGGEGSLGKPRSAETKAKIAAAKIGQTIPDEIRLKISITKRGRKLTPEHRAKLSAAIRPRPTPEAIAKRSAALKGRTFSVEWRAKISAGKLRYEAAKRAER